MTTFTWNIKMHETEISGKLYTQNLKDSFREQVGDL